MTGPRVPHGSERRYSVWGCRCDECVQAHAGHLVSGRAKEVARVKAWRDANPEKHAANRTRYRTKHRGELREKNLAYYYARMESDPESIRKQRREWAKTPKGVLANRLARHARRGAALDREYAEILYGDPCSFCGTRPVEIDHIVPVVAGGTGEWDNLAPACRSCNASKNDRPLLAFMAGKAA
jgi:5-methylcytosine-specific restriction endonuclease McrA